MSGEHGAESGEPECQAIAIRIAINLVLRADAEIMFGIGHQIW
jgi:hypothetical protein